MFRVRIILAVTMATLLVLAQSANVTTHTSQKPAVLTAMYGDSPPPSRVPPPAAAANASNSGTLLDLHYWDRYEVFSPSSLEYDEFDWTFLKRVALSTQDNILVSPLGLKLTLGILKEASTGETAFEIERVLGLPSGRNDVRAKFSSIVGSIKAKSDKYLLELGSRICLGNRVVARQKFSAIANEFYMTEIKTTDFDHPDIAADEINGWVANVTHNKIKKLVSADDVSGVVMMVLNAIYFKGSWRKQFPANETHASKFTYENLQQVSLPFMNLEEKFFFCKSDNLDATLLRLPYQGLKFAMYIVLPNTIKGVNHVVAQLNSLQLRQDIPQMRERQVRLSIPRFRFDYVIQLKEILQDMGIRRAFDLGASFPGISRNQSPEESLRVSAIKQKAGIEVNEEGSEAFAATEASLVNKSGEGEVEIIEFNVNKPFVFFIEDENTRQILFAGKVVDPLTPVGGVKGSPAPSKKT